MRFTLVTLLLSVLALAAAAPLTVSLILVNRIDLHQRLIPYTPYRAAPWLSVKRSAFVSGAITITPPPASTTARTLESVCVRRCELRTNRLIFEVDLSASTPCPSRLWVPWQVLTGCEPPLSALSSLSTRSCPTMPASITVHPHVYHNSRTPSLPLITRHSGTLDRDRDRNLNELARFLCAYSVHVHPPGLAFELHWRRAIWTAGV